jgi:hypothetical protein
MREIIRCWAAIKAARVFSTRTVLRTVAGCLWALSITGAMAAPTPPKNAKLTYYDGPVLAQANVVPVFWNANVSSEVTASATQFFTDMMNSTWYNVFSEYSTYGVSGGSGQIIVSGTVATGITLVPSKCTASVTGTCNLTDAEIQSELAAQIAAGHLPAITVDSTGNSNTVYMIFFPHNVIWAAPNNGGNSGVTFCSYNNTANTTPPTIYGTIIDTFSGAGMTGCGSNSTAFENETQLAALTLADAVTDPDIGLVGNTLAAPAGWYYDNINGGQTGNLCDDGSPGPTITVGGRPWSVAWLFSNKQNACVSTAPVPSAYVLTVSTAGSGIVTSSDSAISCPSTCSAVYTYGKQVTLTATPAAGFSFTGWSGTTCTGTGTCLVTMATTENVTATFTQITYSLSVTLSGSGTVSSTPSGISCGSTCSASFDSGASVTLNETPAAGWSFTSWSGACTGSGSCQVTMTAAESVTATFTQISYTLSAGVSGSGTVTSTPSGISCGSTCSASFASGTQVTLNETPASGWVFSGWSGACSGAGSCVVTMSAAESVTAAFLIAPGRGGLTRTFVSSSGVDTNPCTVTAPCATFARAYTLTQPTGIIAALDPGKYGPLTITYPVTVNGNGWAAITGTANGNGITINADVGNVILTGLEVDGAGAAYNGIVFNSGASLTVSNCIVKDFIGNNGTSGNGIMIAPITGTVDFTIVNTIALNNGSAGIFYLPVSGSATATGAIDHVTAANNGIGMAVDLSAASGGSAAVTISNSIANNNTDDGIVTASATATVTVTVDRDEISSNSTGVSVGANTSVLLSRSVIAKNTTYGVSNSGTAGSSNDNRIAGNGSSDIHGTGLTAVAQQ